MKTWKVLATEDVQADLDNFIYYLLVGMKNYDTKNPVILIGNPENMPL